MNAKLRFIFIIGIVVIFLPILGIPRNAKDIILFFCGVTLIVICFSIKKGIKILRLKIKRIEGQQGTLIE